MREALVDANILLRLLTDDDPDLALQATQLLQAAAEQEVRVLVTSTTVAEVVYVLGSVYGLKRSEVATRLMEFFGASVVSVSEYDSIMQALLWFGDVPGINFADAYLAAAADSRGWAVMSFDRGLSRVLGIVLLDGAQALD